MTHELSEDELDAFRIDLSSSDLEVKRGAVQRLASAAMEDGGGPWWILLRWSPTSSDFVGLAEPVLTELFMHHFDITSWRVASTALQDRRFGEVVLPLCRQILDDQRYKQFQEVLRTEETERQKVQEDRPSIEAILDQEDLDLFQIELLDHLLGEDLVSEAERTAYGVLMATVELPSGGFYQLYQNAAGDEAFELPDALRRIRAERHAVLVEEANAVFGAEGPVADSSARRVQLEALGQAGVRRWRDLDPAWFQLPDQPLQLLREYVLAHRDAFER